MAYYNHGHLSQDFPLYHFADQHHQPPLSRENSQSKPDPAQNHHLQRPAPNWLNNAGLHDTNFLNLQTTPPVSDSNRFFSSRAAPILMDDDVSATMSPESPADLKSDEGTAVAAEALVTVNGRRKAEILAHPLYEQLLSSHVACLRIATPVDQLPRIDAQLAQSPTVLAKYSAYNGHPPLIAGDDKELDHFMTRYVLLLCSFKEQLQQHVRVHAMEAVYACWEIEQSLQTLTGVSPGEGTGATMSDDEDDDLDGGSHLLFDGSAEGPESMGSFGPLIPTETERCLMERVRQELKLELKNGYKEKIVDIREEILRKRRAGKLPGDTTSVLKAWWQSHSKWPYPTEEDKARLVQETGLQLKQINNWFINQRKRNWNTTPPSSSTTSVVKSKRKR